MRTASRRSGESGVILVTTLLIMMIISALMVGFYAAVNSDVRATAIDRDQTQAYAVAHAGLEKLTSAVAQLFAADFSPSKQDILDLNAFPPAISGFEFIEPGGTAGSGYKVSFSRTDVSGNPLPEDVNGSNITSGPYKGLKGIITKYPITITARSTSGNSEVRLRRELQTVAVPVFQFGVFSETDLSIYAGENFAFGGRVHTNGSLFLCQQTNLGTMTFNDRITAVNEVIRKYWSNGQDNSSTTPSCTNNVLIPTSASTNRNLKQSPNEGSVTGMPGTTANTNWTSLSTNTYKSYIRTGLTGAKKLDLPLVSQGATPVDLIRRPALNSNEDTTNEPVFGQRFFSQASLRILLSDRISDFTGLPTITGGDPILLEGDWNASPPTGYGPVDNTHPPIARSLGPISFTAGTSNTSSTIRMPTSTALPTAFVVPCQSGTCASGTTLTIGTNTNVRCTGKTATTLTGCNLAANVANNATVSATLASGFVVSTTVNGAVSSGTSRTVTLNTGSAHASFTTAPFSVNTFFVNGKIYTCTGYDDTTSPKQFTGCSGGTAPNGATVTSAALASQNTPTIGSYIKIEKQDEDGDWTDVTLEILNLGIGAPNQAGTICADPTPDAVLRVQRLRDNAGANCPYASSRNPTDWWPNTLYDPREGSVRDVATTGPMTMAGVIQHITLDVGNLKKWLAGTTGTTGTQALNNNGFIVYFSDRRGNHDSGNGNVETAEFGFEDHVNSTTSGGAADSTPQAGEDMNGNGTQQLYGRIPSTVGSNIPSGAAVPYDSSTNSTPTAQITQANAGQAFVNKVVLFRRALKIANGAIVSGESMLPDTGLTVASENPVYVHGDYNALTTGTTGNTLADPHEPAAIIADAITTLSRAWTDANSLLNPNDVDARVATTTSWRFAALAGKGVVFPYCSSACGSPGDLFGTDGGAGNFLRLLEKWFDSGQSLNYRGSIVTLHNSRQGIGTYKFPNTHIYTGGTRNFFFDIEFLNPTMLPPGTPMFRDVNTLTFRQILRPTQ